MGNVVRVVVRFDDTRRFVLPIDISLEEISAIADGVSGYGDGGVNVPIRLERDEAL